MQSDEDLTFSADKLRLAARIDHYRFGGAAFLWAALGAAGFVSHLSQGRILGIEFPGYEFFTGHTPHGFQVTPEGYLFIFIVGVAGVVAVNWPQRLAPPGSTLRIDKEGIELLRDGRLEYKASWRALAGCSFSGRRAIRDGAMLRGLSLHFWDGAAVKLDEFLISARSIQQIAQLSGEDSPLSAFWREYRHASRRVLLHSLALLPIVVPMGILCILGMLPSLDPGASHASRLIGGMGSLALFIALSKFAVWYRERPVRSLAGMYGKEGRMQCGQWNS